MTIELIDIDLLRANRGQLSGLPPNPRLIKDERFHKLVNSIFDNPEMLEIRECIVVPYKAVYVVIAGNMRYQATNFIVNLPEGEFNKMCSDRSERHDQTTWFEKILSLRKNQSIPCKVLDKNTSPEDLRAYTIKDNVAFGEDSWEDLANDWDSDDLKQWGVEAKWEKEKGKTKVTIETEHTCPNCGHTW